MIPSLGNQRLKPITCNPQMLASYLITDDLEAVKEISNALCNLNTDQITKLTDLIQTNLDTETLINRGEEAANRTLSYNMTRLQNISIPDFYTLSFNPRIFSAGRFNHELFSPGLKSMGVNCPYSICLTTFLLQNFQPHIHG